MGPEVGGTNPLQALSTPALRELLQALRQEAAPLPPFLRGLVGADRAQHRSRTSSRVRPSDLEDRYRRDVLRECTTRLDRALSLHAPAARPTCRWPTSGACSGTAGCSTRSSRTTWSRWSTRRSSPWTWRPGSVSSSREMLVPLRGGATRPRDVLPPGDQRAGAAVRRDAGRPRRRGHAVHPGDRRPAARRPARPARARSRWAGPAGAPATPPPRSRTGSARGRR